MGRKTKYSPELCRQVTECMSKGMTLQQTSKAVGVHISKLCKYQHLYPDFVKALEAGRELFNIKKSIEFWKEHLTRKIGRKNRELAIEQLREFEEKYELLKGE